MAGKPHSHVSNKTASKTVSMPAQKGKQNEAKRKPLVHPLQQFSKNKKVQNMIVFCNICLVEVVGSEALGHLFFGSLKCTKCLHVIRKCQEFRNDYPSKQKCQNMDGNHVMTQWRPPLWNNFYYNANKNFVISQFCDNNTSALSRKTSMAIFLKKHLESLMPLKEIEPWKTAFEDPEFKEKMDMFIKVQNPQQTLQENGNQMKPSSSGTSVDKEQINIKNKISIPTSSSKERPLQTLKLQNIGTQQIKDVAKRPNTESASSKTCVRSGSSPKKSFILQPSLPNSSSTTRVPEKKVKDIKMKLKSKKNDNRITFLHTKPNSVGQDTELQESRIKRSDRSDTSSSSSINSAKMKTSEKEETNDTFPAERKSRLGKKIDLQYHAMLPQNVLISNPYLLIQYPQQLCPEECPNCYFTFTPEMCAINMSTFIIDLQCPNCNLSVYIAPVKLLSKCKL